MSAIGAVSSPVGIVQFDVADKKIRSLSILAEKESTTRDTHDSEGALVHQCEEQLRGYFAGNLQTFDLPIDFSGYSALAVSVLKMLQTITFGTTISYGELAAMVGRPGAARAVGRIVGANRTPIVIPCHRVVGSTGKLVGYSATGGIDTKRWLLEFEQKIKS